jgi:hypothetical protein
MHSGFERAVSEDDLQVSQGHGGLPLRDQVLLLLGFLACRCVRFNHGDIIRIPCFSAQKERGERVISAGFFFMVGFRLFGFRL